MWHCQAEMHVRLCLLDDSELRWSTGSTQHAKAGDSVISQDSTPGLGHPDACNVLSAAVVLLTVVTCHIRLNIPFV